MAQMTKDDIKKLVKEAVREVLKENAVIKDIMSECIKTSIVTILKEINTLEITESKRVPDEEEKIVSLFQETPLVTSASKIKMGQNTKKSSAPAPIVERSQIFNRDSMAKMFEEEFGIDPNQSVAAPPKAYLGDMNDTLDDDPRVLRALGISL